MTFSLGKYKKGRGKRWRMKLRTIGRSWNGGVDNTKRA
jgi:hypothetical protein